jgi:hypothetical protein
MAALDSGHDRSASCVLLLRKLSSSMTYPVAITKCFSPLQTACQTCRGLDMSNVRGLFELIG